MVQVSEALENIKTKKFVLVHGEGFGAWCWYKSIPLFEEAGLFPVAIDLTGSGIEHTDPNSISTLADYSKPLIDYLNNLEDEKVELDMHHEAWFFFCVGLKHFWIIRWSTLLSGNFGWSQLWGSFHILCIGELSRKNC